MIELLIISTGKKALIVAWIIVYTVIISQPAEASEYKKPENIFQCFTCFLKKPSDWTTEQEKRLGKREDPKYVTCRRYKRIRAVSYTHLRAHETPLHLVCRQEGILDLSLIHI